MTKSMTKEDIEDWGRAQIFNEIWTQLSNNARTLLVWKPYGKRPMSMNVIKVEILADTKLSKKILKEMFSNDFDE